MLIYYKYDIYMIASVNSILAFATWPPWSRLRLTGLLKFVTNAFEGLGFEITQVNLYYCIRSTISQHSFWSMYVDVRQTNSIEWSVHVWQQLGAPHGHGINGHELPTSSVCGSIPGVPQCFKHAASCS
jgi:hypothetical protein